MRPFVQLATVLSESQQAVQINRYQQQWDTANAEDPGGSFAASFGRQPYGAAAAAWRAANLHISAANSRGPALTGKAWMNLLCHEPRSPCAG